MTHTPAEPSTSDRSDVQVLARACRTTAAGLREFAADGRRPTYYLAEAVRFEHIASWLDQYDEFPADPQDWPCPLCDAEPGTPCDITGTHHGRGWDIGITQPGNGIGDDRLGPDDTPADTCRPTVETGPAHTYRARCLGCGHRGPVRDDENPAAEDANDHAFPGWRQLPVVPSPPEPGTSQDAQRRLTAWIDRVRPHLPPRWLESGGPIRTHRTPPGTRHVPSRVPVGGGYDLATDEPQVPLASRAPGQLALGGEERDTRVRVTDVPRTAMPPGRQLRPLPPQRGGEQLDLGFGL